MSNDNLPCSGYKTYSICKESKSVLAFSGNIRCEDGLETFCRDCRNKKTNWKRYKNSIKAHDTRIRKVLMTYTNENERD